MSLDLASLGAQIRALREARDLSQQALGDLAGMTQAQVSDIERGRFLPTLPTLRRLLDALGYDLALIPKDDA